MLSFERWRKIFSREMRRKNTNVTVSAERYGQSELGQCSSKKTASMTAYQSKKQRITKNHSGSIVNVQHRYFIKIINDYMEQLGNFYGGRIIPKTLLLMIKPCPRVITVYESEFYVESDNMIKDEPSDGLSEVQSQAQNLVN